MYLIIFLRYNTNKMQQSGWLGYTQLYILLKIATPNGGKVTEIENSWLL